MTVTDDIEELARIAERAYRFSPRHFAVREPFPHVVLDGFWNAQLLHDVLAEFPDLSDPRWDRYRYEHETKDAGYEELWGPATQILMDTLRSDAFVERIEHLTGIDRLHAETAGGGMHQIPPGGHLGVHTDFNASPDSGGRRVANVLIYLNEGWQQSWGGSLELWDETTKVLDIIPAFNRTVIFATSERSWHGHPMPTCAPDGRPRRSVACYYFTDEFVTEAHSTIWHPSAP